MTTPKQRRVWLGIGIALALGALACGLTGASQGLSGYALGVFGTGFSLLTLWGITRILAHSNTPDTPPLRGAALIVVAFIVKVPVFAGATMLAYRIGGTATTCFLVGLGLVYFALVAWALAQS